MEPTEVTAIIENLGSAFEEFKKANDELLKKRDGLTEDRLTKINAAMDKLIEAKSVLEKRDDEIEKKLNRQALLGNAADPDKAERELKTLNAHRAANCGSSGQAEISIEDAAEYRKAFGKFLRKGENAISSDAERKAMSVGSDADGGFLVTPDTSGKIVTRVFDTSPIRQLAMVQTIGTDALEGLKDIDQAGAGWVGEGNPRPATTTPQVGSWRIPTFEMYAMPETTQKVLDDANVDVEAWLAGKVADRMARLEATAFVIGTGVSQPRGFATYPTAATADTTRSWGTFEHVGTGVNGDFAVNNPADIFFDLIGKFKPFYLQNAKFITGRLAVAKVRKFKETTTNAYMWQPGLQKGEPESLLGYPIVKAEDMPALGANSLSLAFGDLGQVYQIVDRAGVRILRDPYTNKPYVRFYTTRRVGGDCVQFEALKFIKFA